MINFFANTAQPWLSVSSSESLTLTPQHSSTFVKLFSRRHIDVKLHRAELK